MKSLHFARYATDVGETGSTGKLLVPDLRSFDLNRIAIAPTELPVDAVVHKDTRLVRPQNRSGIIVKFDIKVGHGALLKLVDGAGVPLPLGSTATLIALGKSYPVGYDGEAYVEDLEGHNQLSVQRPDGGTCVVKFTFVGMAGEIPSLGPLPCMEHTP